jgi:hypothetical protein
VAHPTPLSRIVGTTVVVVIIVDEYEGRDVECRILLDNLVRVGYCGGRNVPLVRTGGRPAEADAGGVEEGAGRPATDTGVERAAPAPARAGGADPELLVVEGD